MESINDKTMQQRLYDILKMNIKLARTNNKLNTITADTYDSFEKASRNIDDYNQEEYEKKVSKYFNTTITLIEEKERLEKLVELVTERLEERNNLLREYEETTSKKLNGLKSINEELELDAYKQRLANIREYLENKKNIEATELELEHLNDELSSLQEQKRKDEEKNYELEDSVFIKFKNILSGNEENVDIVEAIDIDFELEKLMPKIEESKKTLDTFEKAFCNLVGSGISDEKESEYSDYVADAKEAYYQLKEKEILLKLYKLICSTENEYNKLYNKRENIGKLLSYRMDLRRELNILKPDLLLDFYKIIDEQKDQIRLEKINIEKINKIIDKIAFKENKLELYKEANQKSGILAILQEYGIIETYNNEDTEDKFIEPIVEDEKVENQQVSFGELGTISLEEIKSNQEEKYIPNAIKHVEEVPENINVSFVRNKANTVMRRVGKALGIEVPKIEIVKTPKIEEKVPTLSVKPAEEETIAETKPLVNPVSVEEIVPNNVSVNVEEIKPELSIPKVEPESSTLELPKTDNIFKAPVLELAKEDIFTTDVVDDKNTKPDLVKEDQEVKLEKIIPFPTPVLETPKVETKKETSNNTALFWPEAKPNFASNTNNNLEKKDFFPQTSVTNEREFNPQELNSSENLKMPELPQGNINLGPGPGQMANPAIKIRRAA